MSLLKLLNLALAFLLELCMLGALGHWGFSSGQSWLSRIGFGLGVPLLVAVIWGIFLSPRSTVPIARSLKFSLEVILFGCAVAALFAVHHPALAWTFAILVVLNKILIYLWHQ